EKCIQCGKCEQVCPYNAIAYRERPCAAACGVNAITSDALGFAEIDYNKCTSCGLCIVSCPFAAIAEKSEIVQILQALQSKKPVFAEIAPSFPSQFGPLVNPEVILKAITQLGFVDVAEVAYGADITILNEAEELKQLIEKYKGDLSAVKADNPQTDRTFVGTSCCTAWSIAAKNNFPKIAEQNISESYTPMVETAKKIKKINPDAIVVFIGPCIAKKEECFDPFVQQYVDFVMTYEELAALFQAYEIDPAEISDSFPISDASELGRGFPVAGGVANAVVRQTLADLGKEVSIPLESAETLKDCMGMLKKIKQKKYDPLPLLVEGMACPHGCVGGPGTLASLRRAQRSAKKFAKEAEWKKPTDYISEN
ncbi:MAG: 4Fe-4S binding protein, partial [Candidatus Heimdallarchaeota archaeon]|nr:4Fe-4S binding protein [Candidatus Heimdallarchaeota archaeon]